MAQRLTYRRRHSYRTASNRVKKVRTPGNRLVFQYIGKTAKPRRCGDCGCALAGLARVRPYKLHSMKKKEKSVARAYGGSRCASCVRKRILRAFLLEEQKIVKRVLREKRQGKKL